MNGHPQATALYGAPKLHWRDITHPNPNARVLSVRETRCRSYRLYQQGSPQGRWVAVWIAEPTVNKSDALTEADALAWVQAHHAARCAAMQVAA